MNDSTFTCLVCGQNSTFDDEFQERIHVCDDCAGTISNEWNYARSGRYLTWVNVTYDHAIKQKQPIPTNIRWAVFQRDNYKCIKCESAVDLTADHIHPECDGGLAVMDNLQTLCRSCNSRKGKKHG